MPRLTGVHWRVSAPPARVFDLLADVANESAWNPDVKAVRRLTDGPLGPGTEWEGDYRGMGRMRIRLHAYEPHRRLRFSTEGSRADMTIDFDFAAAAAGGTDISIDADLTPKGVMRPLAPLFGPMMRRTFAQRPGQLEAGLRRMAAGESRPVDR